MTEYEPAAHQAKDDQRLVLGRKMLSAQEAIASKFGSHFAANIALELMLELFLAAAGDEGITANEAIRRRGRSANVTWRWIVALQDDGLVQLADGGRSGVLALTSRGVDRIGATIDAFGDSVGLSATGGPS